MKRLTLMLLLFWVTAAGATITAFEFDNPEHEARFKELSEELRCVVCQNQNLADSNAELATDLRRQIYEMIQAGKSNAEITDYMVARYGDFVLYRPPVKRTTILLWVGPFVLFLFGLILLVVMIRRRAQRDSVADHTLSEADRERLEHLVREERENRS